MSEFQAIHSDAAPAAVGPYSQAILCDGWVYCSGQVALDPATGSLVGDTAAQQAAQALANLREVLLAAGTDLGQVVKCNLFLVDMGEFSAVNEVYAQVFEGHVPPARATVEVSALPLGALFEVDCVARAGVAGSR